MEVRALRCDPAENCHVGCGGQWALLSLFRGVCLAKVCSFG